ncbi:hypothetical protein, partial [Halobacillus sp. BBL2006]|uniref:hypothetical protein n=1 Tax=Halobacillus sp. BBL2006 TaxID=1543706 RepID=UPI0006897A41
MSHLSEEKKREIFKEKLIQLWSNGYLTEEEYMKIVEADRSYIHDRQLVQEAGEKVVQVKNEKADHFTDPVQKTKPVKPVKKKKVKSAEQIRERNITWSLILGVCLLLITGLIVATSQWAQMGAGLKVVSISLVSLFFLALSYGTGRFLKIKQTAFAFLTLGSLLIPIVILAIGYFELFGSYLSLFGEGRYLLGLLGALVPLPLYIRHAFIHQSRLYVWISLVFSSLTVGFALGALPISMDIFYLLLMVYNAGLLVFYVRFRASDKWKLFIKEVPLYAQLNLVISTILMLFFFESEVFYSFNLLLTASIYMAMVFVYKTKEYQFVFSVMLIYAIYQLVEHSPLESIDVTLYALVGFIYLGFAYAFRNHTFIEKVFRYTSGVVSFFAFVYISYESIALRGEDGSWILMFAYGIITANYLLLSNLTKYVVFTYLTPVFFFITTWQFWALTEVGPLFFFLFMAASVLLICVVSWTKQHWMQVIQESSFYVSVFVLIACIGYSFNEMLYGYSSFMFLVISVLAYMVGKQTTNREIKETTLWLHPVALFLAAAILYEPMSHWVPEYEEGLSLPFHLAVTGLLLMCVHLGWKKFKEKQLSKAAFYVGQGAYMLAMVLLLNNSQVDPVLVRPLILLAGFGMMFWLVQFSKEQVLWVFVSLVTLAFYISLIDTFSFDSFSSFIIYTTFAPVLLMLMGEIGQKKWPEMRPYFYWIGHGVLPLIVGLIMLNQIGSATVSPLVLSISLILYVYSSLTSRREWEIKLMLYGALTIVFLIVSTVPSYYGWWSSIQGTYAFFVTSIVVAGIWIGVSPVWKKRLEWYWIPFSILGLFLLITNNVEMQTVELLPLISYVCLVLFFLHQRGWSLVRFAPLLLTIDLWEKVSLNWEREILIVVLIGSAGILLAAGRFFHKLLVGPGSRGDAYSWTALIYFVYLNSITAGDENVWVRILPVLLAGGWFFI